MTSKEKALEQVLFTSFIDDDILKIKLFLATKGVYIDKSWAVKELWEDFSSEVYFAGWMIVDNVILQEFYKWLHKEIMGWECE